MVATPSNSWLDDYLDWLQSDACCLVYRENGTWCPSDTGKMRIYGIDFIQKSRPDNGLAF